MELADAAFQICEVGQHFNQRGWTPGTCGNLSMRLDDETIAITTSGLDKGRLSPEAIIKVDIEGKPLDSSHRPSVETPLHCQIYQDRPDCNVVLHVHAPNATVASIRNDGVPVSGLEAIKMFPGIEDHNANFHIPVFENHLDIAQQARSLAMYLRANPEATPAFLIRGHGINAWGRTMDEARIYIETVEYLCDCFLKLHQTR